MGARRNRDRETWGVVAAVSANAWGGEATPADFYPDPGGDEQTPDEMAAALTTVALAQNASE